MGKFNKERFTNIEYGSQNLAEGFTKHRESVDAAKPLTCDGAVNDYNNARIPKSPLFEGIKLPDGTTVGTKLRAKKLLDDARALTNNTQEAIKVFNAEITGLNDLIKKEKISALGVTHALQEIMSGTQPGSEGFLKKLEEQHQEEKNKLTDLFNSTKPGNCLTDLGLDAQPQATIDGIKQQFLDALAKQQTAEKEAFQKSIQDNITTIHQEQADQVRRIGYLADLAHQKKNSDMQKELHTLIAKQEAARNGATSAQLSHNSPNTASKGLKGIKVDDLTTLTTKTGVKILKDSNGNYVIDMPEPRLWNRRTKNDVAQDIRSMSEHIRASGYDTIKFSIHQTDGKAAQEQAAIAYAEALKTGFDVEKISVTYINESGKETTLKGKELNSLLTETELKSALDEQKRRVQAEKSLAEAPPAQEEQKRIKEALGYFRANEKAKTTPGNPAPTRPAWI